MVGEVNGKATSLGVNDDSTIELGDVEQNALLQQERKFN